jgi:hypothetical protein
MGPNRSRVHVVLGYKQPMRDFVLGHHDKMTMELWILCMKKYSLQGPLFMKKILEKPLFATPMHKNISKLLTFLDPLHENIPLPRAHSSSFWKQFS